MGRLFFMALIQLACGLIVWSATLPFNFYLSPFDWAMLILLFPAQIAILGILLINGFEFTEVLWRRSWIRHAGMLPPDPVETAAVRVHPPGLPQRAAGNGPDHAGLAGRAELREFRSPGAGQQHQGPGGVEAGRGILQEAGSEVPFLPPGTVAGLQGGRAEFRPHRHGRARRCRGRDRRRLRRARRLAGLAHRLLPRRRRWPWCSARRRIAISKRTVSAG